MPNDRTVVFVMFLLVLALTAAGCATTHRTPVTNVPVDAGAQASPPSHGGSADGGAEPLAANGQPSDDEDADLVGEGLTPAEGDVLAEIEPALDSEEASAERLLVGEIDEQFNYPIEINDQVLAFLDHYGNRNRDAFAPGLARSGRYLDLFRRIFAEEGVPSDLVYMAHVESAYKVTAYSRAKAKGIWQFIAGTGKRYGLRIDGWVDERSDPEKAARAAARYLRDLHDEFGDWYLAMAAYNAGEGRIRAGLAQIPGASFWDLAGAGLLRRETRNYVPAILAATLISKEPEKYGFEVVYDEPLNYDSVEVRGAYDLRVIAKCAGADPEVVRALNPALRQGQTPPNSVTDVRVPPGSGPATLAALVGVPESERILVTYHTVRRGDTLGGIARKYGTSVSALQASNGMGRSTVIHPGKRLKIPSRGYAAYAEASTTAQAPAVARPATRVYVVHRGDTLSAIAKRYGTTPQAIARANGIRTADVLKVGTKLTIGGAAKSRPSSTEVAAAKRTYTVRRGDSLWDIASRYNTSVAEICRANGISSSATLHPGRRLEIPVR